MLTLALLTAATLPSYNVAPDQISVSGFSSGASMAVQMHVAYSATIKKGAGIIAGAPYFCSQGRFAIALSACMANAAPRNLPQLRATAEKWSARGLIDPLAKLRTSKVYLLSGALDSMVRQPVMDDLAAMYSTWLPAASIRYNNTLPAEHAMPTDAFGNACRTRGEPYINNCHTDVAGAILAWLYGPLNARNSGKLGGAIRQFDQTPFGGAGLADTGYAYIPAACAAGQPCRLHVAFHGCLQNAATVGAAFYGNAGYNGWADSNRMIVLYPQAAVSAANPGGCWDWYGIQDPNFAVKSGAQMVAIKAMIDRIASGHTAARFHLRRRRLPLAGQADFSFFLRADGAFGRRATSSAS